jgi:Domain of Unknown Function (DUF928)
LEPTLFFTSLLKTQIAGKKPLTPVSAMIRFRFLAILAASTSLLLSIQFVPWTNPFHALTEQPAYLSAAPAAFANPSTAAKSLFSLPVSSKPGRSQGSGSRGCAQGDLSEVTLLIPSQDVAGQTVSGHPTFLWKVAQPVNVPIKFTLTRPGEIEPVYETQIDASKAGIVAIKIPADRPELVASTLYQWTVSLLCNEKRPSANPFYSSWVERVPTTSELTQAIATAQTDRDRATIYARSGVWYDALETLYQARGTNPSDAQLEADFNALLAAVGLSADRTASR